jgi:hypothetical protein
MPQIVKKSAPAAKGEMGKPSLKGKFEAAMQKQWKSRPENQMKSAPKNAAKATSAPKGVMKKTTKY